MNDLPSHPPVHNTVKAIECPQCKCSNVLSDTYLDANTKTHKCRGCGYRWQDGEPAAEQAS